ncbi:MAG: hypothetical protein PVI26_07430 [Chitinispirillia bacterium]
MIKRWKGWVDVQEYYLNNDLANPTLVVGPDDLTEKPYLMMLLGSEILKDMVIDVTVKGISAEQATAKAQTRAQQLVVGHFSN